MKTINIITMYMVLFALGSCEWIEPFNSDRSPIVVFKYKDIDYSKNIWMGMLNDQIYMHPGKYDTIWPVKLDSGYWTCNDCAVKGTAYLSVTFSEYDSIYDNFKWPDSLNHCCIIETDPFKEFYYRNDISPTEFRTGIGYEGLDTSKLNFIIREGKLEKYFKREI